MRLAFYQPEIAQNVGTLARTCACFDKPLDIIEPCSFLWADSKLKRAGMDYLDLAAITKFKSWDHYVNYARAHQHRIILLDVKGDESIDNFKFEKNDILVLGQESCGVPEDVFKNCDHSLYIPMKPGCRSLNVAIAGSIALFQGLVQTNLLFQPNL